MPARPRREPLSRERVLRAALTLADAHGLEAVSMRRLAQELGVEAMSLYNHVANKDDILDGLVELVAGEIELPVAGPDWKAAIRRSTISAHDTLTRHVWVASLWNRPRRRSAARLRYADAVLRTLREGGFPPDLGYHAFHILQSHVNGFTLQELAFPLDAARIEEMAARFLRSFPIDEYPDMAEHVRQHLEPRGHDRSTFEFALDLILDGLERLRAKT